MSTSKIDNRWSNDKTKGMSEHELLLYRSNLLGSDLRITNFGGGNTSCKERMKDPLTGEMVEVLWVKGSGGDLGSMKMDGFSSLYMDKLQALKKLYRGIEHEDEMVDYLPHCTFNLNPRAASIDTPLHAFIPKKHVDHLHPDPIIAIAASKDGERITKKIFGDEIGWLPWQRPGFDLGLKLEEAFNKNPKAKGLILASHGLFTWADDAKTCYEISLDIIQRGMDYLESKQSKAPFGGEVVAPLSAEERAAYAARLMPGLRGLLSKENPKLGHFNDSPEVLTFVGSKNAKALAALGTSCPDHFLRTKICPLFLDIDPRKVPAGDVAKNMASLLEDYRKGYEAYYARCKRPNSPAIRDPYPVVVLVPGVGMLTFAKDKATARIAGEFYVNAINVMRGATSVSVYVALDEQEAFDIEYWLLEEAKLQRMPKPKLMAGKVSFVTGGAGGIGRATAEKLLAESGVVVLADMDQDSLDNAEKELAAKYGKDNVRSVLVDVTNEAAVIKAFETTCREFGGVDVLVSNAGISSAAPIEETTLALWDKNISVLATGYFLVSREAMKVLLEQNIGGAIVFVSSKNGLAASPDASAYCTAKAAEIHLARCLALEGAARGIRANVVNPDAVLSKSKIWAGSWRKERAETYGIAENELEEHYRQRSLLKRNVLPEDIAEAVYFLASDLSAKSTGNIINVDAGNAASFTR